MSASSSSSSSPAANLHNQETLLPRPQVILVITVIGLVIAIANIDGNGISTALPSIAQSLHAESTISWTGTSSLIGTTVMSTLYGRFSDVFGRRPLFIAACLAYAAAGLISGFAVDGPMLYVARGISGASGGGLGSLAMIVASDIIPLEDRGKYEGYCGGFIAAGNVAGPFLAAAFVERATWRGFFWMLSPLGVVCAFCAWWYLPPTKAPGPFMRNVAKVDWVGSLLSTTAIVMFLIPISGGGFYYAWDSAMIISMLVIAGVSFAAFIWWEARFAKIPIIPMSMFKRMDVCALVVQAFLLGWVYAGAVFFLPLYYQNLRGWSPIASAALLTPTVGTQVVASVSSGRWISRTKRYGGVIRLGSVAALIGAGLTIILDRSTPPEAIVFILIPVGIGAGCTGQPLVIALQAHTKKSMRAVVISCRNFMRYFGAACGVAVSSAVLQSSLKRSLPPAYKYIAQSVYSLPNLTGDLQDQVGPAYETAIRHVFITNAALTAVALCMCLFWKDRGLKRSDDDAEKVCEDSQMQGSTSEEGTAKACDEDIEKGDGLQEPAVEGVGTLGGVRKSDEEKSIE